jgi:cellulose synthase/poly-beta-1,6-N-acetylglucosamine synthase-like glycosyltransferase
MIYILILIMSLYLVLIGSFIYGFDKVKTLHRSARTPKTKFSVIIPFRNEESNLSNLLQSISQLNYPIDLFEILLIDDESEDNSLEVINKAKLKNRRLDLLIIKNNRITNAPKKDAIVSGISQSKYDWIITTDADCIVPAAWLLIFDEYIQTVSPKMIVAPVTYYNTNTFVKSFQFIDLLSLQGTALGAFGIGRPILCNGANFAYLKQFFNDLKGFEGNDNIASGDDVFMLEKALIKDGAAVHYLKSKEQIVRTLALPDLKSLIHQRVRWAKKTASLEIGFIKYVGAVVLFMNLSLITALILGLSGNLSMNIVVIGFITKLIIDLWLIQKTSNFFSQQVKLHKYLVSSIFYPFFTVFIVIYSLFIKYNWKGRGYIK